ncbi:tetratricopeptide repeat protein, partial [bacterium]|nr:tetratricopeptide repeat protein [bacterium]
MGNMIIRRLVPIFFLTLTLLHAQDSLRTYDTRAIDAFMDGMDLESAGQIEQAITSYKRAITFDSSATDIHFSLARLYLRMEQKSAATASLEAVISLEPHNLEALELLGELAQGDNKNELALSYFERILDMDYHNDYAVLHSAEIYHALGDTIREAEFLIRLWELDTDRL